MPTLIGITLALGICVLARWFSMDRDRAFYSAMTMVVGSYYVLFAVMAGPGAPLLSEIGVCIVFTVFAVLGFKKNPWFLVAGLFGHGVFDFFHSHVIGNNGVPHWWPEFCLSFDVAAAAFLATLLRSKILAERSST